VSVCRDPVYGAEWEKAWSVALAWILAHDTLEGVCEPVGVNVLCYKYVHR
jgi:hypothetical protein